MNDEHTWRTKLSDIMEEHADHEFKRFLNEPSEPLFTEAELNRRITRLMERTRQPYIVWVVEETWRWIGTSLAGMQELAKALVNGPDTQLVHAWRGGDSSTNLRVRAADRPDASGRAGTIPAEAPDWIPVGLSDEGTDGYMLTLKRCGGQKVENAPLTLQVNGRVTKPSHENHYKEEDGDYLELFFRVAEDAELRLDESRIEVGSGEGGELIIRLL